MIVCTDTLRLPEHVADYYGNRRAKNSVLRCHYSHVASKLRILNPEGTDLPFPVFINFVY